MGYDRYMEGRFQRLYGITPPGEKKKDYVLLPRGTKAILKRAIKAFKSLGCETCKCCACESLRELQGLLKTMEEGSK